MENSSKRSECYGRAVDEIEDILDVIGGKNVAVTLDFSHSQEVGQTFEFLHEFKTKLKNVHISGYNHGPVEKDTPNLKAFLSELIQAGYDGPLTIEMSSECSDEEILKTKSNIEEIFFSLK